MPSKLSTVSHSMNALTENQRAAVADVGDGRPLVMASAANIITMPLRCHEPSHGLRSSSQD